MFGGRKIQSTIEKKRERERSNFADIISRKLQEIVYRLHICGKRWIQLGNDGEMYIFLSLISAYIYRDIKQVTVRV